MGVAGAEELLLELRQPSRAGEQAEQGPAAELDGEQREQGEHGVGAGGLSRRMSGQNNLLEPADSCDGR